MRVADEEQFDLCARLFEPAQLLWWTAPDGIGGLRLQPTGGAAIAVRAHDGPVLVGKASCSGLIRSLASIRLTRAAEYSLE
jgi:hypothetical protein